MSLSFTIMLRLWKGRNYTFILGRVDKANNLTEFRVHLLIYDVWKLYCTGSYSSIRTSLTKSSSKWQKAARFLIKNIRERHPFHMFLIRNYFGSKRENVNDNYVYNLLFLRLGTVQSFQLGNNTLALHLRRQSMQRRHI